MLASRGRHRSRACHPHGRIKGRHRVVDVTAHPGYGNREGITARQRRHALGVPARELHCIAKAGVPPGLSHF